MNYTNANSFMQGMNQGLYFVGNMLDLLDRKADRERKIKRETKQDRLAEETHSMLMQQYADLHRKRAREDQEYEADAPLRGLKREVDIAKLDQAYQTLNDPKYRALATQAEIAKAQDVINRAESSGLGLKFKQETYGDRVKAVKDQGEARDISLGVARKKAADVDDELNFTKEKRKFELKKLREQIGESVFELPNGTRVKGDVLVKAYNKYLTTSGEDISFSQYIQKFYSKPGATRGLSPTKSPDAIDLTEFFKTNTP